VVRKLIICALELLVSFFKKAIPSLAPGGSIIVTLFEGEPYTLWNIRDLARHSGLQVERSFKFQASAYPGYHHARTLGVVKSKVGNVGSGWKGEDRPARSYIFIRNGEEPRNLPSNSKRKRDETSSDEDDD
jgi:25S rRNA (uracil2634-N3)-methyltransferase